MAQLRIARSFIAADSLAELIAADYGFAAPITCQLFSKMVRTQDNDHYLVKTGSGARYVARVYQLGKRLERSEENFQFELDWLDYLHREEMPVSYPIPRADGGFLGSLEAPEGLRYYALFSLAAGKPMSLTNPEQLFICGREIARMHLVSNRYEPRFARQELDLEYLVDKPMQRIKEYWDEDRAQDLEVLLISAEEAKEEILSLIRNERYTPDGWGPIGGDFHRASVFFDQENKPTFFNFDLCGFGWRAYDIAVFLFNTDLIHQRSPEMSEAFFAGYYSQRQLSENEHEAIAPFLTIRRIWQTGLFSMNDGLVGHTFIAPAHN